MNTGVFERANRWSAAEAAEHLGDADPRTAVAAALRLLSIRDMRPACVPDPPLAGAGDRLRVVRVGQGLFALGVRGRSPRELRCPVLLTADGDVLDPVADQDHPQAALHISGDPEAFPHLLITPERVWVVGFEKPLTRALVGRKLRGARFELRWQRDVPYVALVLDPAPGVRQGQARALARYVWDPYELSFTGPQRDRLPDPPGGFFVLDVEASVLLTPVGGKVVDPNDPNQVVTDEPAVKLKIPAGWSPSTRPASRAAEPNEPNEPNEPSTP